MSISARIWLSIGIFIPGSVITMSLHQIQGRDTEQSLQAASEALFPAEQKTQEAEVAFHRAVKDFGDAVIGQDAEAVGQPRTAGSPL